MPTHRSGAWLWLAAALCSAALSKPAAAWQQPPLSEILVEVTRGSLVESRHYGRIVAVQPDGTTVLAAGNPQELIFPRSALKPIQALATVVLAEEQGIELPVSEVAMMCASHDGHDYHVAVVAKLLARAGATDQDLFCGEVNGSRLGHNCSGKHGGMLVQAKLAGNPLSGYWEYEHPVQQRIRQTIAEFTGYDRPLEWGLDGCGVPNYALPLERLAIGYARLANPAAAPAKYRKAAAAIRTAMQTHPELLSSKGSFDAQLIAAGAGRLIGKTGAEACYAIGLADPPLGIAVKIEDGNPRGMPAVLLAALERVQGLTPAIDAAVGQYRTTPIPNSVGATVGEIRAASQWGAAAAGR